METEINEIMVNGTAYVKKGLEQPATKVDGLEYVVVRATNAGVFAGYLEEKDCDEVTLCNVRRLWYWSGASSCSQLAKDGTSKPNDCKFTAPNKKIIINGWIEILPATEKARTSIEGVKIWQS